MSDQKPSNIITLENVRLSYFYGFQPYEGTDKAGKPTKTYCAHAMMDLNHPGIAKVRAAQRAAAQAEYGPMFEQQLAALAQTDKLCLHNGDVTKIGNPDYVGKLYVSANNKTKPRICVTRGGQNLDIGQDDPYAPYSGCWANVIVDIWAQGIRGKSAQWGKRVNATLLGVQFVKHDTAFGGGGRVAKLDEFGLAPTDADAALPAAAAPGAAGLTY